MPSAVLGVYKTQIWTCNRCIGERKRGFCVEFAKQARKGVRSTIIALRGFERFNKIPPFTCQHKQHVGLDTVRRVVKQHRSFAPVMPGRQRCRVR